MNVRLNPFHHLLESKKYPWARVLRSSWKKKIMDSFETFHGNSIFVSSWDSVHLGLIDYMTLFSLALFHGLMVKAHAWRQNENKLLRTLARCSWPLLVLINIPLFAIRFVASVALTMVSLPFTFFASMLAYQLGHNDRKLARSLTDERRLPHGSASDSYYAIGKCLDDEFLYFLHPKNRDAQSRRDLKDPDRYEDIARDSNQYVCLFQPYVPYEEDVQTNRRDGAVEYRATLFKKDSPALAACYRLNVGTVASNDEKGVLPREGSRSLLRQCLYNMI